MRANRLFLFETINIVATDRYDQSIKIGTRCARRPANQIYFVRSCQPINGREFFFAARFRIERMLNGPICSGATHIPAFRKLKTFAAPE